MWERYVATCWASKRRPGTKPPVRPFAICANAGRPLCARRMQAFRGRLMGQRRDEWGRSRRGFAGEEDRTLGCMKLILLCRKVRPDLGEESTLRHCWNAKPAAPSGKVVK